MRDSHVWWWSKTVVIALALVSGLLAATPRGAATPPATPIASQLGPREVPRDLAAGKMLVAQRRLRDPNFLESVVLLFAYSSKDGAAGLIVNRKTTVTVRRVLPDLPIPRGPEPVAFFGGPVAPTEIRGLLRGPALRVNVLRVLPDVALVLSSEALEQAVAEGATSERLRLYEGYAGWSPGQLEREIQRGDWHVTTGDSANVFAADPEAVWRRQIRLTDVLAL